MAADPGAAPAVWDGHLLLLHATERERRAGVLPWVRRGLDLGEKVILTETPSAPAESLVAALVAGGIDAETALGDGWLAVLPLDEFYPPEGQHALVERSLAQGFAAVRMSVEVNAALRWLTPSAYPAMERGVEEMVRTLPVSVMCQYSRSATTGPGLDVTVADHLTGVRQASFRTGPDPHGLVLHGELDVSKRDVIDAVVCAAVSGAGKVLSLDLADVAFLDVVSCRRLEELTRDFRAAGGLLKLLSPRSNVERVLRLVKVDQRPGINLAVA